MRDMTKGSPAGHLWAYALPLLLGNWLQLSYNAVDSIIAGRFIGQDALAASGVAGPLMNLVILAISGLCIGAGVLMSEFFGAKDYGKLSRTLATTLLWGGGVCVAVAGLGILFTPQLLRWQEVPEDIWGITITYLRITFLGAPFTFFYNALAASLKSVGDTKTPLKFLAFSAVLNAGLDLIFLGIFRLGIICSATTTVVAEAASAALALWHLRRAAPELWPEHWAMDRQLLKRVLAYGGPTLLQQAVQPICKVLIQGQVNALGVSSIAAFHAVTKVDDFACIPAQGISSAISTYIAQNRGAQRWERIRPGFRVGLAMEVSYWVVIGTLTALFRRPMVSMFITGEASEAVVSLGSRYLLYMTVIYLWPTLTNGIQGFYRGMGMVYITIFNTALQAITRTVCTYWLAPQYDIVGIAFACCIGWSAMLLFGVPYYFYVCRKAITPQLHNPK